MILFPNCKINIGLHVTVRRNDGFHDIDTLFYPVPFHDALEAATLEGSPSLAFSMTGADVPIPDVKNLCVKAYHLLAARFPRIAPVRMHLHKCLPTGAGLGGGSSDGAHALLLLNSKLQLGLTPAELGDLALLLGSDCPFFIQNVPAIGRGRGEQLEPIRIDLSGYLLVLVHPRIHINTAWAFSQIHPDGTRQAIAKLVSRPVQEWKETLGNDFEAAVFREHSEVGNVKDTLYAAGAVYASLSGSGSAVFGLFPREKTPQFAFPPHYLVKVLSLPG
jgi:4-diphosphocytidyl-2-C-methyl-D-erythritol kinase